MLHPKLKPFEKFKKFMIIAARKCKLFYYFNVISTKIFWFSGLKLWGWKTSGIRAWIPRGVKIERKLGDRQITGSRMRQLALLVQPGDYVFRKYHYHPLQRDGIGYWDHVCITVDTINVMHILDSGVVCQDVLDFMIGHHSIAIVRRGDADNSKATISESIKRAWEIKQRNPKYDTAFTGKSGLSCANFAALCYDKGCAEKIKTTVPGFMLPDDFFNFLIQNGGHIVDKF